MIDLRLPLRYGLLSVCLLVLVQTAWAQLDTIHWIPPVYARADWGPQYIVLTTPETQDFPITIRDGSGQLVKTAVISNTQPLQYLLSDTYSQLLVFDARVHQPLTGYGLVITGSKPFYASLRVYSESLTNAAQLSCKGRAALGTAFRIGNIPQGRDKTGSRSNFIGVMATEDGTTVTLTGFNPLTFFTNFGFANGPVTIQLNRGESVVFAHDVGTIEDDQPTNGFMGSLISATRPVTVSCGSWLGAPTVFAANDIGIDQALPLERVSREYILCHGNGPTTLEHPIVIAHTNHTYIWLNEDPVPFDTLDAGQYAVIPAFYYLPDNNLYIRSSEPVFVYQLTGGIKEGVHSLQASGFMAVPPLNCGISNFVNNIYAPSKVGAKIKLDGGLTVVALRDSAVTVTVDGKIIDMGPPTAVRGNPDFVTYQNFALFNHVKADIIKTLQIEVAGVVQMTQVEWFQDVGFSAFYSDYQRQKPFIHIDRIGDGVCPDTLLASGFFDGVQWVYEDSVLQQGPDQMFIVLAPGPYKAVGYLGGCFHTATVADSLVVPLTAPYFPFFRQIPSCFGFSDGEIAFGTPVGGASPYRYSIDFGRNFSDTPVFKGIPAGAYKLVVQDNSGCYNQPVSLQLGQPDSIYVNLVAWRLPDPFKSGELAELEAFPSQPVSSVSWSPPGIAACSDCLLYDIRPEESTWVVVTVRDEAGCPAQDSMLLVVDPRIFAPNVLAPGSANGNDRFSLWSKETLPIPRLVIYDRWGEPVFEKTNWTTNDPAAGWDGQFRGKTAAPGVYVFIAEVELEPGRVEQVSGSVTVF